MRLSFAPALSRFFIAFLLVILATTPVMAGKVGDYPSGAPLQSGDATTWARGGVTYSGSVGNINTFVNGAQNIFVPSDNTCTTDVTAELESFAIAHDGYVNVRSGDCLLVGDLGSGIASTDSLHMTCEVPGTCTLENVNDDNAILYWIPDNIALDSHTSISAVGTGTINNDDVLQSLTVASTTGYEVGDWVLIADSVAIPNRVGTTKTINGVSSSGGACVIQTSADHGYSNSQRIFIKGVTATVGGTDVDYIDGSEGYGRTYNITVLTSTTFSLQALNNDTDTTSGTNVDCATGTYSSGGTTSRQNTWASEGARVAGVDTVGSKIYLEQRLQLAPLYVQSPQLYRYTKARQLSIDGFLIQANGDTSDLSISTSDAAIDVMGVPEARFENLTFNDTWDAAILRRGLPGSIARNIKGTELPNRGTNDPSGTPKTVTTISVASQAVFTSTAHGFSNGGNGVFLTGMPAGWETFNNIVCRVSDKTNDTFKCKDTYGNYLDSSTFAAFSGTATAGEAADVTGLGYLMSDNGACVNCISDGLYSWEGRHTFTSDGSQLSWAAVPTASTAITRNGVPTYGVVQNVISNGAYGRSLDTHEEIYGYIFKNWQVNFPERGPQFGSYEGACGQIRGDDITFENVVCRGGKTGIRIVANEKFKTAHYKMDHVTCEGFTAADGSGKCIEIQDWSAYTYKPIVEINDLSTTSVSIPISIGKTAIVRMTGGNFRDFDDVVDCAAGATFESFGSLYTDFRDPGLGQSVTWTHKADSGSNGFNAVIMRSDAPSGGCTARISGLVNVQGTGSNLMSNVFRRQDTTATKYYRLQEKLEFDPSGVGSSGLLSSATSMTELTDAIHSFNDLQLRNGKALQTGKTAADTAIFQAYDVDGAAYTTFATLTANNTPTLDLSDSVTKGGGNYIYRAGGTDIAVADGGTNQSSYTKGDILAASAATTLNKLGIGSDGKILKADANSTNGLNWFDGTSNAGIASGRYLVTPRFSGVSAFSHSTANVYAVPVYVEKRQTFTGIGFGIVTSSTNLNVKVAAYTNSSGAPGTTIAGSATTCGPYTVAVDTTEDCAFSVALTFDPGWYWLAIQTDQNQSIYGLNSASTSATLGTDNMIQTGPRISVANTYASGLPSPFGTPTYTANAGSTHLSLKAQ